MFIRPKTHLPFSPLTPCLEAGKFSIPHRNTNTNLFQDHFLKLLEASINKNKGHTTRKPIVSPDRKQQTQNIMQPTNVRCSDRCSSLKI